MGASGIRFEQANTKVHLACRNGTEHPLDVYYEDSFKTWQEHQTRRNFKGGYILSLIDLGAGYSTELLEGQSDIIGRIIVQHQRTRNSYVWLKPETSLLISEIKRERMTIPDFPGYNNVTISHATLKTVTRQNIQSWRAALSNVKGIYLISDTTTGKQYVGKASGHVGLWQRWCAYAEDGHGGKVKLKGLLAQYGHPYSMNYRYSLLEIADTHASEQDIIAREVYWMGVLQSRDFGLN